MRTAVKLKQFIAGNCYSYILVSNAEAVVIDPHISLLKEYLDYVDRNKLKVRYIIDTHTHADHFSLAAVLKKKLKVPVLMHEKAVSDVADRRLKDGDEIFPGNRMFKIRYAPGHTDDTMNIYGEGMIFTADVLLVGSVGRTDFQNGSPESMFDTLQGLKKLPDSTLVYPAHDYNGKKRSTIGREKKRNPFMRESDRDRFIETSRSKKLPKPFNIENIIRVNQKGQASEIEMISARQAFSILKDDKNVKLLDVRTKLEFDEAYIEGSVNIPVAALSSKKEKLKADGVTYIVLCRTGTRSMMAADMLISSGIGPVKVMEGGISAWKKENLPVKKGQSRVSLERQVRAIAGGLVLTGIILSWILHPYFIFLSVFVSCGLIFAGITDNCLMGLLLMKLPYNKKTYGASGGTCSISQ